MAKVTATFSTTTVAPSSVSAIGRNNLEKMKAFFSDHANKVLYPIGRLLAWLSPDGKHSYAELVVNGDEVEFPFVMDVRKTRLELATPLVVSLNNVSEWGCRACQSAHGTRKGCSNSGKSEPDYQQLASNKWYYSPVTKTAFVISDSCWQEYVLGVYAYGPKKGQKNGNPVMISRFVQAPKPQDIQPSKAFKPSPVRPDPPNPPTVNLEPAKA